MKSRSRSTSFRARNFSDNGEYDVERRVAEKEEEGRRKKKKKKKKKKEEKKNDEAPRPDEKEIKGVLLVSRVTARFLRKLKRSCRREDEFKKRGKLPL